MYPSSSISAACRAILHGRDPEPATGHGKRPRGSVRITACLFLVFWGLGPATTEATGPQGCAQVQLSRALLWTTSGVWLDDGQVLLVDILEEQDRRFLQVAANGNVTPQPVKSLSAASDVSQVRRTDNGIILYDRSRQAKIRYLGPDSDLAKKSTRVRSRQFPSREPRTPELDQIYDFRPFGQGFLAFGDINYGAEPSDWESAFLYFDDSGRHQLFYRLPITAQVCNHYLRNMPYIATLGESGFILFMNEKPVIAEVTLGTEGVRELEYFPPDFQNRPRLETQTRWIKAGEAPRQATYFYQTLESSTIAAGLYAWNGQLYLLGKKARIESDGRTAWWLVKLDPRDGSELTRVRLPTDAAHLTVVPGETWTFVEKGPVEGIGPRRSPYMETSTMVRVPAAWLEEPASGPLRRDTRVSCPSSAGQASQ